MNYKLSCVLIVILSATGILSGCTGPTKAYTGPSRSADETATLIPQGVTLLRVNGIDIPTTSSGAVVLAGRTEIELSIDQSNFNLKDPSQPSYKLRLDAKAGRRYAITGQRGDGRLCAFPIDPTSGLPDFKASAGCLYRE